MATWPTSDSFRDFYRSTPFSEVVQLDLALLLAGTRYRGDFEARPHGPGHLGKVDRMFAWPWRQERLRAVVKEVTDSKRRVILVVDEAFCGEHRGKPLSR